MRSMFRCMMCKIAIFISLIKDVIILTRIKAFVTRILKTIQGFVDGCVGLKNRNFINVLVGI